MPQFSEAVVNLVSGSWKRTTVTGQGGLLSGMDPASFNSSDPLRLWIIQMGIIVMMSQLLSLGLGKIKQPKVIAEVLGGILLGPTAFGRIPGFTAHIFPSQSIPYLSLVANIGLCLFLFIIGLEIDATVIKRNARKSLFISLSAIALSFSLGVAISVPLYHNFIPSTVKYTYFMLFTGVSFSITAFPVLCRILTALQLLDTTVGVIVLSAGVCNDVVGWSLLALAVALVNATSGLTALWILLTCIAFAGFLLWPVRIVLLRFARFTGSTENGPTMFFMTVTMIVLWACAFFTDIVGVNAIFGAFLAGIIVPREGGLAISLTEKLEDMVTIIFLPLYFTLSGLNTNLGLLNNGITWAFTFAIICLDFAGKFTACTITSRITGMSWRESSTVGSLMSCKGLVELIVLNIGLSAGILTQRVFSMFVFEALILTFMTTPLVSLLYPPERRIRATAAGVTPSLGEDDFDDKGDRKFFVTEDQAWRHRFTVVLDKFEHMSGMLVATQLLCTHTLDSPVRSTESMAVSDKIKTPEVSVDALRLIELSDRTSAVMKSSVADTLIHTDPVLSVFRTFGELNDLPVSLSLSIVPFEDMPYNVADHAKRHGSQLILLPWLPPATSGDLNEDLSSSHLNPLEAFFGGSKSTGKSAAAIHSQFVRRVFAESKTDVALFIDPGVSHSVGTGSARHVFFPFFGGPDDRLALEFVVQLCANPRISATVVRMTKSGVEGAAAVERPSLAHLEEKTDLELEPPSIGMQIPANVVFPDTFYGQATTQTRFQSETADSVLWGRYAKSDRSPDTPPSLRAALSRIRFSEQSSPIPLHSAIQQASAFKPVLVVVGRSRRLAAEDHTAELRKILEEGGSSSVGQDVVRKTIGDGATAFVASACATAVVVLQAANLGID